MQGAGIIKMEIFDITDDNGVPTGKTISRNEAHEKGIPHRTAHIWIARRKGDSYQVLLQKRSAEKESYRDGTFCVPIEGLETLMKYLDLQRMGR